jgi:CRISPR-associated protein Cas6/Cse3/CasE, subtype I-E/ECOLI
MYLTRLPNAPEDDYQVHQKIRKMFPGNQKILFQRCDEGIFILSEKKPGTVISVKEIDISIYANGGQFPFSLRLNPAKRDKKTGKRVAIDPLEVKEWIKKQLSSNAVGIEANFQYLREGIRRSIRQGKTVSLVSVLTFGVLTIKDASLFQKALTGGIGHGKGFGFGLINLFA